MRKKLLLFMVLCVFSQFLLAQITINSEPSGAKVFQEGKYIGTTPCKASVNVKASKLVYDIDADKVSDPSRPPYSYEFTVVMDGYEPATVYFEGKYEYRKSGWVGGGQKYYLVSPKSYKLFAVLKKDYSYSNQGQTTSTKYEQPRETEKRQSVSTEAVSTAKPVPQIRWHFDSDPEDAKIFWKVKSSIPSVVKSTDYLYLGKTPFNEIKPLNIKGVNDNNSDKVEIEIKIEKEGYSKQSKSFSVNSLITQDEISWFFDLKGKKTILEKLNIGKESNKETTN